MASGEPLTIPVQRETWLHEKYEKADLRAVVKMIACTERTGSLTIHFNRGHVGALEWRQRDWVPKTVTPPVTDEKG